MALNCSNRPGNMRNRLLWSERLYPMYRLSSQFQMVAEIGPFEGKVSILVKSKGFHKGFPLFYIRKTICFYVYTCRPSNGPISATIWSCEDKRYIG